jgi:hypothetical protein
MQQVNHVENPPIGSQIAGGPLWGARELDQGHTQTTAPFLNFLTHPAEVELADLLAVAAPLAAVTATASALAMISLASSALTVRPEQAHRSPFEGCAITQSGIGSVAHCGSSSEATVTAHRLAIAVAPPASLRRLSSSGKREATMDLSP